jgi:hypothetical protein
MATALLGVLLCIVQPGEAMLLVPLAIDPYPVLFGWLGVLICLPLICKVKHVIQTQVPLTSHLGRCPRRPTGRRRSTTRKHLAVPPSPRADALLAYGGQVNKIRNADIWGAGEVQADDDDDDDDDGAVAPSAFGPVCP